MLKLNLISNKLKQEIRLRRIFLVVRNMGLFCLFTALIISNMLLLANLWLQLEFVSVVNETTLITKSYLGNQVGIKEVNSKINFVDKIQGEFVSWPIIFEELSKFSNNNLEFSYININKEKKEVEIKGVALKRDDLLEFKKGMDDSPIFSNIYFPIKNILEKENINFEIKANIELSKI